MNEAAVFDCDRCGICCEGRGGIVLAPSDIRRMAAHLEMTEQTFLETWTELRGRLPSLIAGADGFCAFFQQGFGCSVHAARPDVCRAWPFFRGNLEDAGSFRMAKEDCKGIRDVPHAAFQDAGLAYLHDHTLAKEEDDAPNALRVTHLTRD